jgi:hypothetical protein
MGFQLEASTLRLACVQIGGVFPPDYYTKYYTTDRGASSEARRVHARLPWASFTERA